MKNAAITRSWEDEAEETSYPERPEEKRKVLQLADLTPEAELFEYCKTPDGCGKGVLPVEHICSDKTLQRYVKPNRPVIPPRWQPCKMEWVRHGDRKSSYGARVSRRLYHSIFERAQEISSSPRHVASVMCRHFLLLHMTGGDVDFRHHNSSSRQKKKKLPFYMSPGRNFLLMSGTDHL